MKILVIGSKGFIGSHCCSYFREKGDIVFACDIAPELPEPFYISVDCYKPDYSKLFKNQKFDVCINASGSANVNFSFQNPEVDYILNVENVKRLLIEIKKSNPECKFINISSAAVYGNPVSLPISETASPAPISPYGKNKLQSEALLNEFHIKDKLNTCSIRIFSAYGPGLKKQLFWDIYQKALAEKHCVKLFGTGNETRDFIFITDIIHALEHIIERAAFAGEAINVASGTETSIKTAATLLIKNLFPALDVTFMGKKREGDPDNWVADITKLRNLGFSPQVSFEDGIKQYVQWLKEKR